MPFSDRLDGVSPYRFIAREIVGRATLCGATNRSSESSAVLDLPMGTVRIIEWLKCHENIVSECWIAEGSDLARETRYDGNFQGTGPRTGNDAQVEPGRRSTSRSHRSRRREQGGLSLSIGTLWLLANWIAWNGSALGNVWRKLYH